MMIIICQKNFNNKRLYGAVTVSVAAFYIREDYSIFKLLVVIVK